MNRPDPTEPAALLGPTYPSRGRRRGRVLAVICWLYLALVLGLWLLLAWADLWWPASILMFAPRGLLAVPLLILVPWALLVRRRTLAVLALTAGLIAGPIMGFCVPWQSFLGDRPAGQPFRVLTCNMHYWTRDTRPLAQLIADLTPDIVALQEWPLDSHLDLLAEAGWHMKRTPRLFLASRFPIRQAAIIGNNSYGPEGSVGHYQLETPVGLVHVFVLHFASPRRGIFEVIHEEEEGPVSVETNISRRWDQTETVLEATAPIEGPQLVLGDFNTPPQSRIFDRLWYRYTDAFSAAGWGWGYTFYGGHTMVRIDHILAGQGWFCNRCWVGPNIGSPHQPVIADLIWTEEGKPKER